MSTSSTKPPPCTSSHPQSFGFGYLKSTTELKLFTENFNTAETLLYRKVVLLLQYHWCNTDVPIKGRDVVDAPRDVIVFEVPPQRKGRRELTDAHGPEKQRLEKRVRGWWLR